MATVASRPGLEALQLAKLVALLLPALLLAGALGSQHLGGLVPCEMCYWQRWAHWTAVGLATGAFLLAALPDRGRSFVWLAALAIAASGTIAVYHAGVEAGVFAGATQCTTMPTGATPDDILRSVMNAPMIRCDEVQWRFAGVSMAGWNAILSLAGALAILWLSLKRPPHPALA